VAPSLRGPLAPGAAAPGEGPLRITWAATAVLVEGAGGLAALEGRAAVRPEHVLVAALQSTEPELAWLVSDLGLRPDLARGLPSGGAGLAASAEGCHRWKEPGLIQPARPVGG